MPFTVTMPKLSPTMESGVIVKWHKKEGDSVAVDDLLFEVATDKATVEHNALDEGFLRKILVHEQQDAFVNQAVAIFTEKQDESIEGYQPEGVAAAQPNLQANESQQQPIKAEESSAVASAAPKPQAGYAMPVFEPEPPLQDYRFAFPTEPVHSRIKASPLARKLAREKGLDIASVQGSGPGGRVVSKDLDLAQPLAVPSARRVLPPSLPAPGSYEELPLSPMRKVIAQRLQESKSFIPHFYVTQEVDARALARLRNEQKELGIKLTYNDFVIRACALALKKHPQVNSGFNSAKNCIVNFSTVDICVAVALPQGLITPILRHADYKNVYELSVEIKKLSSRAKEGKLDPHEYKGGSFTVSNLGMFGITHFQAIINPPQSAILAVGGLKEQPIVENGVIVPGQLINLTLSVDHRVIDGVLAALFINTVKFYLEHPSSLLA